MMIKKKEITFKNIYAFIQGNFRYKLYYSKFSWLISKHIRQQIKLRIQVMDRDCYLNGSCKICGCKTTALQMANKSCAGNCYPIMMNKIEWYFLLKQLNKENFDVTIFYKTLVKYPEYFSTKLDGNLGYFLKQRIIKRIIKEIKNGKSAK